MSGQASELARRLAREAEAVCRAYLSHGRRQGGYWTVGDIHNTPGRSLYVRLKGGDSGPAAAGKWTDAATGEHGDLLDLIALNRGLDRIGAILDEARAFLSLPRPASTPASRDVGARIPSSEAARRLFHAGRPITDTPAEAYLRARGITASLDWPSLRFHPSVYYRAHERAPREVWPALLAAVTDLHGTVTGLQRTWLDSTHACKAPLGDTRRALGRLLGNGVRFGLADAVLAVGEGIETMLALKSVLPGLPMIAALSANHVAALEFPLKLKRLYIARDNDAAGRSAARRLADRGAATGIEVCHLIPALADFNADLERTGAVALLHRLAAQLHPADRARFVPRKLGRDEAGAT